MTKTPLLALGLAAGLSLPAATAATAAAHHPAGCGSYAKHEFGVAFKARAKGNIVKVKLHPATFVCGGDNDGHFNVSPTKETVKLHHDTIVRVLDPVGSSQHTTIDASQFPHWLKHEDDSKIYKINGPFHHVRRFVGQYRP
jgi:hypothetical protein